MLSTLRALAQPVLTRIRRGGRRVHEAGARVHVELRGVDVFEWSTEAQRLEVELEALPGVRWARVNLALGAVIIERAAAEPGLEALVEAVTRLEATLGARAHKFDARRPERHPGDAEPIERTVVELAADGVAVVTGAVVHFARLPTPAFEIDLAALLTLLDTVPGLRKRLEDKVSIATTELGLELAAAFVQALIGGETSAAASTVRRGLRLNELRTRRTAWRAREPEVCGTPDFATDRGPRAPARPGALPDGPLETYARKAGNASIATFLAAFAATRSLDSAAAPLFAGTPRPATLTRDAFASWLSARLTRDGFVVMEPQALRRLDRITRVVIETDATADDPDAERVLRARLTAAGLAPEWLTGASVAPRVRALQAEGHGVALLCRGAEAETALADVTLARCVVDAPPPWGAHLWTPDDAWRLVSLSRLFEAAQAATRKGVKLSMAEAGIGLVLSLGGLNPLTTRRVMTATGFVSLVALAQGVHAAEQLDRRRRLDKPDRRPAWHAQSVEAVLDLVSSGPAGLDEAAAQGRRPAPEPPTPRIMVAARHFAEELDSPMTPLLLAGAGLSALSGGPIDAALIVSVLALNGAYGGLQRYRAREAVEALAQFDRRPVRVLRGQSGGHVGVPPELLVVGDVVVLEAGDVVPGDARLLTAVELELDESNLTGESLPVAKATAPVAPDAVVADRRCMLYADTVVAAGQAVAVLVAVGRETETRRADDTAERSPSDAGVDARLEALTRMTAPIAAGAGLLVGFVGALRGAPSREVVGAAVSLTVAAVPEGLPLLASLSQLASARRLAGQGALVRNPRAIEALGRMDVLCADKTGTLTEGHLRLVGIHDGQTVLDVSDASALDTPALSATLDCLDRATPRRDASGRSLPHPTDEALRAALEARSIPEGEVVGTLPFEPRRAWHAAFWKTPDGQRRVSVKGAPEQVLERCKLKPAARRAMLDAGEALAADGLRVLALAEGPVPDAAVLDEGAVQALKFMGFVGLADPPRASARAAIDTLRRSGVRVMMITGDHPRTAAAIATRLDLGRTAGATPVVMTGAELDALDDDALAIRITDVDVFARATPRQKVRIVQALRTAGHAVGMTGDGANDAPAIRLADVGIALGQGATEAARGAADVVISDGRIETIVSAVIEGRGLWAAVRDAVAILVGGNLGEIGFTVVSGLISGLPPLNARQLLVVNLLTDTLPALAVALRPPVGLTPEALLASGPDRSLGDALIEDAVTRAIITATATTLAWGSARLFGTPARAGTVALVALTGAQLGQTLAVGGRRGPVLVAGVGSLIALAVVVQTPGVSTFFGCTPLGPLGWAQGAGAAVAATGAALIAPTVRTRFRRRREKSAPSGT